MLNNYLFYFNSQISNNKFKNIIFFNIYNIIMNIQTNDKIRIQYGDNELIFVNLEEALKEFNEENLNKIVKNVFAIIENDKMKTEEYHEIWKTQMDLLKQDFSFTVQEGHIIFRLGNSAVHRKNDVLMEILKKYVDYVFEKKNTEQEGFKMIKSKKNKHFKELESKGGIKESDIDTLVSKEHNINNLLTLIGNNRQQNIIKFK